MSENINTNKEGEWIYKHWCYFECSKCGFGRDKYKQESLYPYCPMCGVKMKQYENNKQIHGFIWEVMFYKKYINYRQNRRNQTKSFWYSDENYIIQKL